jgi:tetratricopeptide (TPR) repeat protein
MIVRDEAAVIERCLASVHGLVDRWVICDTGSTDATKALIETAIGHVPGELHERPWVDFGKNRTELMKLARRKADYLLLLDADMTVERTAELPEKLTADSYYLRHAGEPQYFLKQLVSADLAWRYEGSTHEYLTTDGPEHVEVLDSLVVHHHGDGGHRAEKFERDLELLEAELARDPSNARAVFYLAQTMRDLGRLDEAAELYERRANMAGWEEEVFYALYQAGVLRADLGDWPSALALLLRAWSYRPARVEPLYELATRLRLREEYHGAHLFASRGLDRPKPDDLLFVSSWIYRWGLLFEYSITAYWAGDPRAALAACDRLLAVPDLPDEFRRQTVENRQFCLDRLQSARRRIRLPGVRTGPGQRTT